MKPYKSIRVFENPYLERLSHVHPITPLVLWGPIAGWLIWRSFAVHELAVWQVLGVGVLAIFIWTFVEYILHRFVFHYEGETALSRRTHFLIHGLHHADPNDPTRLVMPPAPAIFAGVVFYSAFRPFLGPIWIEPFFGFFVVGYLGYDYIHFATHHFTPHTRLGRYIKQSHMLHHFACPESRWGVSSPFWDYVFGTMERTEKAKVWREERVSEE
jgi:sterol desaturase/sphingolipid hydroxylase (fatty acid hydroxylase superfamily)